MMCTPTPVHWSFYQKQSNFQAASPYGTSRNCQLLAKVCHKLIPTLTTVVPRSCSFSLIVPAVVNSNVSSSVAALFTYIFFTILSMLIGALVWWFGLVSVKVLP